MMIFEENMFLVAFFLSIFPVTVISSPYFLLGTLKLTGDFFLSFPLGESCPCFQTVNGNDASNDLTSDDDDAEEKMRPHLVLPLSLLC